MGSVRIVRKCIALLLYAILLLPGAEHQMASWLRAIEASTAVVDRTMRRRKSKVENDRLAKFMETGSQEDRKTGRDTKA